MTSDAVVLETATGGPGQLTETAELPTSQGPKKIASVSFHRSYSVIFGFKTGKIYVEGSSERLRDLWSRMKDVPKGASVKVTYRHWYRPTGPDSVHLTRIEVIDAEEQSPAQPQAKPKAVE